MKKFETARLGALLLPFALACGSRGGPKQSAVVRLDPGSGAASTPADEERTLAVLRARLERLHAGAIGFDREPGQPSRYRVSYRGALSPESLRLALGDHRLEFRELADPRDWPDESAAHAALGEPLPAGALLLPDAGRVAGEAHAYLVREKRLLSGCDLDRIEASREPGGRPALLAHFTPAAAEVFRKYTREHLMQRLAIVYDGQVLMAPTIQSELGADLQIVGNFTEEEARDIVFIFSAGCPPLRPVLEKTETVPR